MERGEKPPWANFLWRISPRWSPTLRVLNVAATAVGTPADLVEIKNSISEAPSHIWEFAKKISNPYELVYTYKDEHIPTSISVIKPLSRSYFKMVEMLTLTGFLTRLPGPGLRTAHVCEGPGGFIEAIYDLAPKKGHHIRQTHAMTLRSTRSHIPGWRRAQQFMNRHREIRIEYGPDNTGNILRRENRAAFIAESRSVHIFTADGGFDFTNNYSAQESTIFPLLLASIHVGFSCLARDGLFILKVFDCFSTASKQLVAFMAAHFNKWTLYKPATSRPCNSEHYFIGTGFRSVTAESLRVLEDLIDYWLGHPDSIPERLFEDEIPPSVAQAIDEQVSFMHLKQLHFLQLALGRAHDWKNKSPSTDLLLQLWSASHNASYEFVRHFSVIHQYPIRPVQTTIRCLALPSAEIAGSGEDYEVDSVPRDESRQSLTLDDGSNCPATSGPT